MISCWCSGHQVVRVIICASMNLMKLSNGLGIRNTSWWEDLQITYYLGMWHLQAQHFPYLEVHLLQHWCEVGILVSNGMGMVFIVFTHKHICIWVALHKKMAWATTLLWRDLPFSLWELLGILLQPSSSISCTAVIVNLSAIYVVAVHLVLQLYHLLLLFLLQPDQQFLTRIPL